jgi:antitoxin YefM
VEVDDMEPEVGDPTEYLLRNPNNAAMLRRSVAELERGETNERELVDPDPERDVA